METPLMKAAIFRNYLAINIFLQNPKINKLAKNSVPHKY